MHLVRMSVFNRQFLIAISIVLGGIAAVFGLYELLAQFWLREAYPGSIYYFHLARGVGASLFVSTILIWYFLGNDSLSLGRRVLELSRAQTPDYDHEALKLFAEGFVQLRWGVVLSGTVLVYVAGVLTSVIPDTGTVLLLFALLALLGISNVGYYLWQRYREDYRLELIVQMVFDLLLLTLLLIYSGGLKNPLFLLYLFHVIFASIIFRIDRALLFTTLTVGLLCFMGLGDYMKWIRFGSLKLPTGISPSETPLQLTRSPHFVFSLLIVFGIILYATAFFTSMLMNYLRRSRRELLHETNRRKNLLEELFSAQEKERARIGRELHDQIGQTLTVLQMKLSKLVQTAEETPDELEELKTYVEDTIEEVRSLSSRVRPPGLDECGLPCAIDNHITEVEQQYDPNVRLEYVGMQHETNLSSTVDIAIYRIVQEALLNAFLHANADQISVILHHEGDEVRVLVEDDGTGFDLDTLRREDEREYLGIQGMQERITQLDGQFLIETEPGHGTQVEAVVPLTDRSASAA